MNSDMISQMMKNPEMIKMGLNMMKDPAMLKMGLEMLNKNPNMLDNPEIKNNISSIIKDNPDILKDPNITNNKNVKNLVDNLTDSSDLDSTEYSYNESVIIHSLKNDVYNGQTGIVKGYDKLKERYVINIISLKKEISIKDSNIRKKLN